MKPGVAALARLALLFAALILVAPGPAAAQSPAPRDTGLTTISLDQARALARRAFLAGEYVLANRLAHELLKANPQDVAALIVLAATEPLLGRPRAGRVAGREAWHATKAPGLRHEIAFYTARAALFEKRFLATRFWLRRAWQTASDDQQRRRIAYDFRRVKAVSPWSGGLSLSLAPSSNLNGGSQWDWLLIDDTYIVGELSGSAQALSGWHAAIDGELGYKISRGPGHETILGVSAYHSFSFLSDEARALAPDMSNGDLSFASLRLFADHRRDASGQPLLPDHLRLSLGQNWYGGTALGSFAALKLGRTFSWGGGGDGGNGGGGGGGSNSLQLSAEARQDWTATGQPDAVTLKGRADFRHRFGSGAQLSFGIGVQNSRSGSVNNTFSQGEMRLGYAFARPLGPARISVELGLRGRDYPSYYVGPFAAPNGRGDVEMSAAISFSFEQADYLGFTPVLTVNTARTISNITRFESRSFGVSLGFRSVF